jgi:hypothetical protein
VKTGIKKQQTIERATPSNPKYGKWFTSKQVLDMVCEKINLFELFLLIVFLFFVKSDFVFTFFFFFSKIINRFQNSI